ncbi:MAG TPA: prepilin-type N-terminal cleavage/methylation domain-containing protein [Phycisphaerae bacterium]|nr:prepilin-type N-terminal cleavage/methylation domain-containing protein [Phycisphaerae bacterium]
MSTPAAIRSRRAFSAMELMIVITILSIVSVIGIDTIASFEANQRADRACREALAFFRFARHLAMTTGKTAEVRITPASSTFAVYWMSNGSSYDATPYPQSMVAGGQMIINMSTERELLGTTLSATGGATDFAFGPLGSCSTAATITFSYGHSSKTLVVPQVGDPQIQ